MENTKKQVMTVYSGANNMSINIDDENKERLTDLLIGEKFGFAMMGNTLVNIKNIEFIEFKETSDGN
ncbi:hypothetical protein [Weissella tructae]